MPNRTDLECAIMNAEGAAAVLSILENHLESSTVDGWHALKLEPREDLRVRALSPMEERALNYASQNLQDTVAEVSKVFYAAIHARTL